MNQLVMLTRSGKTVLVNMLHVLEVVADPSDSQNPNGPRALLKYREDHGPDGKTLVPVDQTVAQVYNLQRNPCSP